MDVFLRRSDPAGRLLLRSCGRKVGQLRGRCQLFSGRLLLRSEPRSTLNSVAYSAPSGRRRSSIPTGADHVIIQSGAVKCDTRAASAVGWSPTPSIDWPTFDTKRDKQTVRGDSRVACYCAAVSKKAALNEGKASSYDEANRWRRLN